MVRENNNSLSGFDLSKFHEMYYAKRDKIESIKNDDIYLKSLNLMYSKYSGVGNPKFYMYELIDANT